MMGARSARNM